MRVSQDEKAQIREKILSETLGTLKVCGQSSAPVDKIMKNLGLTSGALYSHFKSKDDLFSHVVLHELERLIGVHQRHHLKHGVNTMSKFIEYYLDDRHIEDVERGCVFVALGSDLHRLKASVREKIEERLDTTFAIFACGLPHKDKNTRLTTAKFIFSSMIGAMVLARSLKSKSAKSEILKITKKNLLTISRAE